jgi:uncharacterized protein with ATP-grasp and redox domains
MKATPACIPCYLKQALSAALEVTEDVERQRRVLNEVARLLPDLSLESTPAHNSTHVLWRAQEILGCADPWRAKKRHYNALALRMYPQLAALAADSPDRLDTALRIAAAGNVMDLGILSGGEVDVPRVLEDVVSKGFAADDARSLKRALRPERQVLYLLDNAGEAVFDRVLIEELSATGLPVTVASKGAPILNDATMEDALRAGLDKIATVISNGSPMIGTDLGTCSEEFLNWFAEADVIISKGQANFETLNETVSPTFFILRAKCPEVARELGVSTGDVVAKFNSHCGLAAV